MNVSFLVKIFVCFTCVFIFSCTIQVVDSSAGKQNVSNTADGEVEGASDENSLSYISAGDKINIQVYNEKELSGIYQVSSEGYIIFPFIGEIMAAGTDNFSLALKIAEKLKEGYLKEPSVTVLIEDSMNKRIFVLGQVKNAGSFPIRMHISIVEAISLAGGFTNFADLSNVIVTRKGADGREKRFLIDIKAIMQDGKENFYLDAGDIVFVGERFF